MSFTRGNRGASIGPTITERTPTVILRRITAGITRTDTDTLNRTTRALTIRIVTRNLITATRTATGRRFPIDIMTIIGGEVVAADYDYDSH
jgi:hypothetical protein